MATEIKAHHVQPYIRYQYGYTLGQAVVQLVEALRHKPEGCGFDSQWCHWNFLLT